MLQTICAHPELRAALCERAAHYCSKEADQNKLIDRTISAVIDDPELVDSNSIEDALFKVMHRLAKPALPQSDPSDDRAVAGA